MSILKIAIIAGIALTVSVLGAFALFSASQSVALTSQTDNESMNGTNGKHFNLELNESVNVKGSP